MKKLMSKVIRTNVSRGPSWKSQNSTSALSEPQLPIGEGEDVHQKRKQCSTFSFAVFISVNFRLVCDGRIVNEVHAYDQVFKRKFLLVG